LLLSALRAGDIGGQQAPALNSNGAVQQAPCSAANAGSVMLPADVGG